MDAYVTYWNTQRRQVKLKGLTWRSSEISPW
ncbi:IS3 family transposase [Lancefieldella rimae]